MDVQMYRCTYTRTSYTYESDTHRRTPYVTVHMFFVATSWHKINLASPSLIYTASSRSNVWNQRDHHFFLVHCQVQRKPLFGISGKISMASIWEFHEFMAVASKDLALQSVHPKLARLLRQAGDLVHTKEAGIFGSWKSAGRWEQWTVQVYLYV